MTEAMPFLQKAILLSYAPRPLRREQMAHAAYLWMERSFTFHPFRFPMSQIPSAPVTATAAPSWHAWQEACLSGTL